MTRSRRRHWDRRRSNSPWLSVKLDSMWAGLIMEPELNLSKTATRASNQGGGGVRPGVLGQQWVEVLAREIAALVVREWLQRRAHVHDLVRVGIDLEDPQGRAEPQPFYV